ncbi:MAG: hypothetical protein P0Y66_02510 [Candidatus Kaistia colombiensis]|nr:MAG: hypothetical protein P0Y66_02510 [Kaistia sp.]
MKYRIVLATAVVLGAVSSAFAFGSDNQWTAGWGQGVAEAIVTKGPGNQIYVTCDDGAGREATGIRFMLLGDGPTGSSVQLTFDGEDPEDYSIWDGQVKSSCHACAGTYDVVIAKMKKHRSVHVRFENGNAARFTLKGASKAIGKCVADFYR